MFLKNADILFKSNSFKVFSIYNAIFITFLLIIGFYSYSKISNYVIDLSREKIVEEFDDFTYVYENEGFILLLDKLLQVEHEGKYFIRLIKDNDSYVSFFPYSWIGFDPDLISNMGSYKKLDLFTVNIEESKYEYFAYQLSDELVLQIGQKIDERVSFLNLIKKVLIYSFVITIFITFFVGIFLADRSLSPIRKVIEDTKSIIEKGQFYKRIELSNIDNSYNELISQFNLMLERIDRLLKGMRDSLDHISHDLRTPLARFQAHAEASLNSDNHNNERLKEALYSCLEESDRIKNMFNTILDISEAHSGSMIINKEETNIKELVDELVDAYSYLAEENNIKISTKIDKNLHINADRNKIKNVLSNLIDNSIKYNVLNGEVSINASRNGVYTIIQIEDTGIGIEKKNLQKIWERMYRVDSSRPIKGHGLGLSFAKAIVNAHGGAINVSSELDAGTNFTITLPSN